MAFRIKIEETLYTTETYEDDGIFLSFLDKYGKHIKVNKNNVLYIREC